MNELRLSSFVKVHALLGLQKMANVNIIIIIVETGCSCSFVVATETTTTKRKWCPKQNQNILKNGTNYLKTKRDIQYGRIDVGIYIGTM